MCGVSFYVNPPAVKGLSDLVLRNAQGMWFHHELICKSAPTEWDEGILLNIIAPKLDGMQEQAKRDTEKASMLLSTCGAELEAGANHYADIDKNNAKEFAALDAKFPYHGPAPRKVDRSEVTDPESATDFEDVAPLDRDPRYPDRPLGPGGYTGPEPTEYDAAGEGWRVDLEAVISRITSKASTAGHIRGFLVQVLGVDPFEVVLRLVAGRWDPVMRNGMAIQNLGRVSYWVAANVDRGRFAVQDQWDGNAANAAEAWLQQYADAARTLAAWGQQAGDRLQSFASTAYHGFEALDGYLNLVIDTVIDALTLGAAGIFSGLINASTGKDLQAILESIASIVLSVSYVSTAIDSLIARAHEFVGVSQNHWDGSQAVTAPPWPPELGGFNREEF